MAIWNARSSGNYAEAKKIRDTMIPYMDLAVKYSGMGGEYKVIALLKYMADLAGCLLYTSSYNADGAA